VRQFVHASSRSTTRICALIYSIFREEGGHPSAPIELPSQATLGLMARVSRETVSRAVSLLSQRGIIRKQRNQILVVDPDALQRMASA
jgi:DNA-binding transcriptional regulator YhcF (GntR family)